MTSYPSLKNPPIVEAVLDVKVNFDKRINPMEFASFNKEALDEYPVAREKRLLSGGVQTKSNDSALELTRTNDLIGYIFKSQNTNNLVQARNDGFIFNSLKPYSGWESLHGAARPLWRKYRELYAPFRITRLALRYINVITLPSAKIDLKDYILTSPELSPKISQSMVDFFLRVAIPNPKRKSDIALLTIGIKPPILPDKCQLLLDIDVYREVNLSPESDDVWNVFEELRNYKNEIFFGNITDRTREMFN